MFDIIFRCSPRSHLRLSAHLRHRRVTELDGESAFIEKSLGRRFCASPSMAKRERTDRVGNAEGGRYKKMPEGLVTFARPTICPHRSAARKRERRKRGQGGKKGSRIYVRKERSKIAKVQWHLLR